MPAANTASESILAAFKPSTEIPEDLKALKMAATAASEAFHAHKFQGDHNDVEAVIAFDMAEKRLLNACGLARREYESALARHMASEAV